MNGIPRPGRVLAGILGLSALTVSAAAVEAQSTRERLLVDAGWLAERLDHADLVLLHVGSEEEYAAGHIPGARHITLDAISAPEDHAAGSRMSLELPDPEVLARTLEDLGISDDSRVVVYWGSDWVTPAARVVFTLDWIGLGGRTVVLQGGMPAWQAAGGAVTAHVPTARRGRVTPRPRPELVVSADWVHERLTDPAYRVVDARAAVHYDGIQPTYLHRRPVRLGHVPGAASIPAFELVDEAGRIRSEPELRALFQASGVEAGQTVVGYCHLGQYATLLLFAARTLGYDVKLYDGSFQEWGSQDRPVELPPAAGGG
ncbi:MAG TPA: rhodanese-like domain-containing protein [Longimicrobiales bacterium]|nr:rhodanese-like domain-containing protein [Longimicrobiales bacterium]